MRTKLRGLQDQRVHERDMKSHDDHRMGKAVNHDGGHVGKGGLKVTPHTKQMLRL